MSVYTLAAALSAFALQVGAQLLVQSTDDYSSELKPQYVGQGAKGLTVNANESSYYVFLQRFPLQGVEVFYHTEVLVCGRGGFSADDQSFLDQAIAGMQGFSELEESWWQGKTASCIELGYGGSPCTSECCSVGHDGMPLNKRQAVIRNADLTKKHLFIYGTGGFDGATAFHNACDKKCWSNWAGLDYNPLSNNCNTFTSTVLSCVYGLSQKKPHLGVSDLVTVHCKCPAEQRQGDEEPAAQSEILL
jgi:hypothetical protein